MANDLFLDCEGGVEATRPFRILLVDDSDTVREGLRLILEDWGFRVDVAGDGKDALARVICGAFDVVVMDVRMPVMDGYAAVRQMRARGFRLPVVALTADAVRKAEPVCLAAGFTSCLTKSTDIGELMASIGAELARLAPSVTAEYDLRQQPAGEQEKARMDGPRFQRIAEKFGHRFREQLDALQQAMEGNDFSQVADIAHWLRGTAGSVGFAAFVEPAQDLEDCASRKDIEGAVRAALRIRELGNQHLADHREKGNRRAVPAPVAPSGGAAVFRFTNA